MFLNNADGVFNLTDGTITIKPFEIEDAENNLQGEDTGFLEDKGISNAVIIVDPENKNSLAVPKRCGFQEEGDIVIGKEKFIKFTKKLN